MLASRLRVIAVFGAALLAMSCRRETSGLPGTLSKPLDQFTGDEFLGFVGGLKPAEGHERERKCRDAPGCEAGATTKVYVNAFATEDSLSTRTVPKFGVVYVHAVNRGGAVEARYGMKPGPTIEYFLVVVPDSAKGMTWELEEVDSKARTHTTVARGPFTPCNHTWKPGAEADFKSCENSASAHDSVVHLSLLAQGSLDDPIWGRCSEGCCVAM